jgi:energy-coupling factor transporter ATP-binding protein EcfA2
VAKDCLRTHLLARLSALAALHGAGDTVMTITLGTDSIYSTPYRIDPARHVSIVGATGVGKSSLLEHLFVDFIRQGHGGLFIDVHGDVADRLTMLLPSARMKRDFIWFDPDADSVPGFNPLSFSNPEQLELAKETCLALLKALAGSDSAWGNETPHNFRTALDAVTERVKDPTLVHVLRYILEDQYRAELNIGTQNPFLKLFTGAFNRLVKKDQAAKLAPLVNKLSKLMRPNILPIIANPDSLDPLDIMNGRKIMVCRISKGRLGEETAMILYSLIVSMFSIAALRREHQADRPPFIIVADEAQNGVHGGRFGTLLAEARKYGISLVTAFQGAYQMPVMPDVLTNAATQIVFNASGDDAKLFADNWRTADLIPTHITELSRYEFYSRTFKEDQPIVRRIKAPAPLKLRRRSAARLMKQSLQRWASPKEKTLAKISTFLA